MWLFLLLLVVELAACVRDLSRSKGLVFGKKLELIGLRLLTPFLVETFMMISVILIVSFMDLLIRYKVYNALNPFVMKWIGYVTIPSIVIGLFGLVFLYIVWKERHIKKLLKRGG